MSHGERAASAALPQHDAHAAVAAWRALDPHGREPSAVETIKEGSPHGRSVHRLLRAGPEGAPVIAKRYRCDVHNGERVFYQEILPLLPVSTPRCYGEIAADDGFVWIFVEDAGDERLAPEDAAHRKLATRWLGAMHAAAPALLFAGRLPDRGPRHYRTHLETGRRLILDNLGNPVLRGGDLTLLHEVVALCETLDRRWGEVEAICAAAPATLVHGDFRPKNVFVQSAGQGGERRVLTIDWETAGWGPPAADLAPARRRDGPHVDLEAYCAIVRERWPGFDMPLARRLTWTGLIFRRLAAIEWAGVSLAFPVAENLAGPLAQLRVYHLELTRALGIEPEEFARV